MKKQLIKPQRGDFEKGPYGKRDYEQAVQVCALAEELLARGMTGQELYDLLKRESGGFVSWDFLFHKKA